MLDDFKNLRVKGAYVRDAVICPKKKLLLNLMVPVVRQDGQSVTRSYDVQFNKIEDFEIELSAAPWLEVVSHSIVEKSALMDRVIARFPEGAASVTANKSLHHFRLVFDEGQMDVIAETCTVSLVEELPAFDPGGQSSSA